MDNIDEGKGGGDKNGENPPAKRSKMKRDPDSGDGGGGGGDSGGSGGSGIRAGLARSRSSVIRSSCCRHNTCSTKPKISSR